MDQRTEYLLQILGRIGSPLMASIIEASGAADDAAAQNDARRMAELLSKTVQVSIDMANMSGMAAGGAPDDSVRVALAALAGPLVAGHFRQNKKVPGDNDLKRIVTALQAVLSFSENFTPGPENTARLETLEASGQVVDTSQTGIQYIQAFVPVVNAISAFSFGQPEQKLITEIGGRLTSRSAALKETIFGPGTQSDADKRIELALLKALALVYAACHEAETARLTKMSEEEQVGSAAGSPLERVWTSFDLRTAMLETLALSLLPGAPVSSSASSSQAPAPPPARTEAPPPVQTPPVPASAGQANPLSMFAKPKSEAPSQTPPPASPPKEAPSTAPDQKPASGPPGSGPMSFFKKE